MEVFRFLVCMEGHNYSFTTDVILTYKTRVRLES